MSKKRPDANKNSCCHQNKRDNENNRGKAIKLVRNVLDLRDASLTITYFDSFLYYCVS